MTDESRIDDALLACKDAVLRGYGKAEMDPTAALIALSDAILYLHDAVAELAEHGDRQ